MRVRERKKIGGALAARRTAAPDDNAESVEQGAPVCCVSPEGRMVPREKERREVGAARARKSWKTRLGEGAASGGSVAPECERRSELTEKGTRRANGPLELIPEEEWGPSPPD